MARQIAIIVASCVGSWSSRPCQSTVDPDEASIPNDPALMRPLGPPRSALAWSKNEVTDSSSAAVQRMSSVSGASVASAARRRDLPHLSHAATLAPAHEAKTKIATHSAGAAHSNNLHFTGLHDSPPLEKGFFGWAPSHIRPLNSMAAQQ